MAGELISQNMGMDDPNNPNPRRNVSWTSPNGLTTTGTMNPLGLKQNDPSMGYFGATPPPGSPGYAAPATTPAATPTQPPAPTPPVSPLAPGQTDPTGDARRAAAYAAAGYTKNAQGGWDNPTPFGPGGTDPTGDARRLAAYQSAGYTQNAQGGWDAPTPQPNEPQPMATGDPRRNQPLIPNTPTTVPVGAVAPDAGTPPMATTDLISGLRRPGMSNRGGMSRRVPGY